MFYMYSRGEKAILPKDLTRMYKNAFNVDLSYDRAKAMINGMQVNPRPADAPSTVTKCEFVHGYMQQRGFLTNELLARIDINIKKKSYWDIETVLAATRSDTKWKWTTYLDRLFSLDRDPGAMGQLSTCEIHLLLASCRMHHYEHYLSYSAFHDKFKNEQTFTKTDHPWASFHNSNLFPQSLQLQKEAAWLIKERISNLFLTHDINGDGSMSRSEFSDMVKTMDLWQDLVNFQVEFNLKQQASLDGNTKKQYSDDMIEAKAISYIDIGLLRKLPILSSVANDPQRVSLISQAWDGIKDNKTRTLAVQQVARMLRAGGKATEREATEQAEMLLTMTQKQKNTGVLGKQEYVDMLFSPPIPASIFRMRDLETANGYLAGYVYASDLPHDKDTVIRYERQGKPVSRDVDRTQFVMIMPIIRAFGLLRDPGSRLSSISLEEFSKLPRVWPRLALALALRPKRIEKSFNSFLSTGRKRMTLADFTLMLAEENPSKREGADPYPLVTITSLVTPPKLKIQKTRRSLAASDRAAQERFEEFQYKETIDDQR